MTLPVRSRPPALRSPLDAARTVRPIRPRRPRARPVTSPVDSSVRSLVSFAAVALPVGWVFLSLPLLLDLPLEPFVLATLGLGLVAPALVLTARESGGAGARALLRDAVRLPRPLWWGPVAALGLPVLVWSAASALGGAVPPTGALLTGFAVTLVTSAVIVDIWEEVAWTGVRLAVTVLVGAVVITRLTRLARLTRARGGEPAPGRAGAPPAGRRG